MDVNNDDASLWRIEAPPPSSLLSRTGSRGIGDQAPPPPVLPKVRRDSGLPVLESRPSFSHRVQVWIFYFDFWCLGSRLRDFLSDWLIKRQHGL